MVEAEANKNLLRLTFNGMAANESQALVQGAHLLAKLLIAIAFIISALSELILQLC